MSIIYLFILTSTAFAGRGAELFKTCIRCHGVNGEGKLAEKSPQIAGQHEWYTIKALNDFISGARKNPVMLPYIKNLSQSDFAELSAYIRKLKVK